MYEMPTSDSSFRTINSDSIAQSLPLNFARGGDYNYNSGNVGNRNNVGYYWESEVYSSISVRYLVFYSTNWDASAKGNGFSLRCLVR